MQVVSRKCTALTSLFCAVESEIWWLVISRPRLRPTGSLRFHSALYQDKLQFAGPPLGRLATRIGQHQTLGRLATRIGQHQVNWWQSLIASFLFLSLPKCWSNARHHLDHVPSVHGYVASSVPVQGTFPRFCSDGKIQIDKRQQRNTTTNHL